MKYYYFLPLILCGIISCNEANHIHEEVKEEHHHADEIIIQHEKAERFGVETTIVQLGNFHETIVVSGQIYPSESNNYTISASKPGIVTLNPLVELGSHMQQGEPIASISANNVIGGDEDAKTKITLDNAESEYRRIKSLYDERLVSEREYITAQEAYQQALNAYKPQTGSIYSTIAGNITAIYVNNGDFVETGTPIAQVTGNKSLILRADLPERYGNTIVTGANFKLSYSDSIYNTTVLGGNLVAQNSQSTMAGYIPIYFKINGNDEIRPNSYAQVYLIGKTRDNVISLPVEALTEEQGDYFVYERIDEEGYIKHMVEIGATDGSNVEIKSGIQPGMKIVTKGATVVKLAANAGAVPGHSHEH